MKQQSLYVYYNNIIRNAIRHGKALGGMPPEMATLETVARSAIDKLLREGYVPTEAYAPKNILAGKVPEETHDLINRYFGEGLVFNGRQVAASRPEPITLSAFLRCVYALKTTHRVYQASLAEMLELFERDPIDSDKFECISIKPLLSYIRQRRVDEITEDGRVSREVAMLSTPAFLVPWVVHNRRWLRVTQFNDDGSAEERDEMYADLVSDEHIKSWIADVATDDEGRFNVSLRATGKRSQTWFETKWPYV